MTKGMNWRRSHFQTRSRDHGTADWHGGKEHDAAARWLAKRSAPAAKPKAAANVNIAGHAPRSRRPERSATVEIGG
jgi:hypothetical protein